MAFAVIKPTISWSSKRGGENGYGPGHGGEDVESLAKFPSDKKILIPKDNDKLDGGNSKNMAAVSNNNPENGQVHIKITKMEDWKSCVKSKCSGLWGKKLPKWASLAAFLVLMLILVLFILVVGVVAHTGKDERQEKGRQEFFKISNASNTTLEQRIKEFRLEMKGWLNSEVKRVKNELRQELLQELATPTTTTPQKEKDEVPVKGEKRSKGEKAEAIEKKPSDEEASLVSSGSNSNSTLSLPNSEHVKKIWNRIVQLG